ncbi:DUF5655 domain-containing protein [Pseudonocardia sp. CA-107938]|uniref:DUF5655 domain-containing protein n=1 Tax=Pseudonocardia sp. CA-107938 TaxID=3240021 RepID=UPI003D8CB3CF
MTGGMWTCPSCARTFAAAGPVHTCRPLGDLDAHFARSEPQVRAAFDEVVAAVRALGPVEVLPQTSRIALHVRMSFAAFTVRRRWLDGHVVLGERVEHPRFTRIEEFSRHNVLHAFRLHGPAEVDADVRSWLAAAYRIGRQEHRS